MKAREARHQCGIIPVASVAVQFRKIREEQPRKIQRVRPLRMARNLGALPGAEMSVELALEFAHLLAQTLQLFFRRRRRRDPAQIFDFALKLSQFPLSLPLVYGAQRTTSTASAPHISRTLSTSLSLIFTR